MDDKYFDEWLDWRNKNPEKKFHDWVKLKADKLGVDMNKLSEQMLKEM